MALTLTSKSLMGASCMIRTLINRRFDYIARDNHAIGQGETVSLGKWVSSYCLTLSLHDVTRRLIRSARVIKKQICYDIKDASTVYELCWSRFSLHKRIYNHKTGKLKLSSARFANAVQLQRRLSSTWLLMPYWSQINICTLLHNWKILRNTSS